MLKTHNVVVATLWMRNMALGAPLRSPRGEKRRWNDKRIFHGGVRQTHVDIALTAQKLQPFWGTAVIDGFEGMEGNGPNDGIPVPSRIAIASTDYVAADRVGIKAMGVEASWVGYLGFCARPAWARATGEDRHPRPEARGSGPQIQAERRHPARAAVDGTDEGSSREAGLSRRRHGWSCADLTNSLSGR